MISCSVTIYPVIKAKPVSYPDLVCQPDAISVDSNNVQTQPLRIRPLNRIGGQMEAMKAYIRVSVKSGDVELGQAESGAPLSEWDYYLPSDKWGEADNVLVTTYEDPEYATRLAEKQVSILRQHATPFPVEGGWRPLPFKYKNGEYFVDNERNLVFQWMNPVPGNSEIHPFEDIKNNPNATSWKQHTEWVLLATQVFLANFAKLGSAVFDGDYTISQHGKDTYGNDSQEYTKFKVDKDGKLVGEFTPNFMVDWMRGKVVGRDMEIKRGKVANFDIRGGILKCDSYAMNAVVLRDSIDKTISLMGSPLKPSTSAGFKLGMYFSSDNNAVNVGLKTVVKGSTIRQDLSDPCIGNLNLAIDAVGGANILPEVTDRWCVPGVLKVLEIELLPRDDGTGTAKVVKLREWGHGIRLDDVYTSNCDNDSERMIYFDYYCKHEMVFMQPVNCSAVDYRNNGWFNFTPNVETRNALIDGNRNLRRMAVTWWDYQNKKRVPRVSTYVFIGLPSPEPTYTEFFKKDQMDEILNSL